MKSIFTWLKELVMSAHHHHPHHGSVISGFLVAHGSGVVEIPIRGRPSRIEAVFTDENQIPTCNNCTEADKLEVDLALLHDGTKHPHHYAVKINWDIISGGTRHILWKAYY